MLRIRNLSNALQKRTLRVLHGQTQATPYAGTLHPLLRNTDGSFKAPLAGASAASAGLARLATYGGVFTLQGGLVAGTVLANHSGETFVPHNGADAVKPFGLLANFVGGTLDDLQDANEIGVWYGPGSVYEVLYPAFNDSGLAAKYAAATAGVPVLLYAGADGRLCCDTSTEANGGVADATNAIAVAELIERRSAGVIQIKLLV